jgi:hypothetical protein
VSGAGAVSNCCSAPRVSWGGSRRGSRNAKGTRLRPLGRGALDRATRLSQVGCRRRQGSGFERNAKRVERRGATGERTRGTRRSNVERRSFPSRCDGERTPNGSAGPIGGGGPAGKLGSGPSEPRWSVPARSPGRHGGAAPGRAPPVDSGRTQGGCALKKRARSPGLEVPLAARPTLARARPGRADAATGSSSSGVRGRSRGPRPAPRLQARKVFLLAVSRACDPSPSRADGAAAGAASGRAPHLQGATRWGTRPAREDWANLGRSHE